MSNSSRKIIEQCLHLSKELYSKADSFIGFPYNCYNSALHIPNSVNEILMIISQIGKLMNNYKLISYSFYSVKNIKTLTMSSENGVSYFLPVLLQLLEFFLATFMIFYRFLNEKDPKFDGAHWG